MAKRYHFAQVAERRKLPRRHTRRALRQKVPAHRSRGIGRDETADFDIAAKTDIPNDGFAKRVSGVSNDRLFRHLPPQTIDWNPISSRSHVVLGAMPVGNIAAWDASRAEHALEPGANIVRHIFKLSAIDRERSSRDEDQRSDYEQQGAQQHRGSPHSEDVKGYAGAWLKATTRARRVMLSHRNIARRRTALVNTIDRAEKSG